MQNIMNQTILFSTRNYCDIEEKYDDRCNFERDDETGVALFHDGNDAKTGKKIRDDIASAFENHML
jgi:hypothetical protein